MLKLCFIGLLLLALGCDRSGVKPESATPVATGWEYYRLGEFDLAARAFQRAAGDPATREAGWFGEAQVWHWRAPNPNLVQAAKLYRQVVEHAPTSDWAAWSRLALAQIAVARPVDTPVDVALAERVFLEVFHAHPGHPAGHEAFVTLQSLRLEQNTPASWRGVAAALDEFLAQHPQTSYASAAYGLQAHCYRMLQEPASELAAVRQQWQADEDTGRNMVGTYWRIATLAEFDLGDFATAREFYRRLIAEYPTEQRVFLAKQELQRMDDIEAELRGAAKGGR